MLRTICICIVMTFSFIGKSQSDVAVNITINSEEETKKERKFFNEIGIGTSIITQFFKGEENSIIQNPYFFTYKFIYGNFALRAGLGGKLDESESFIDGTSDKLTLKKSNFDWRIGLEYRMPIGERWLGTFGADYVAKKTFDERVSNSGFDKVVIADNQVGSGGGLAIGVQYALTPKLMLGTEAAFYYLNVERKQMTTFENLPEFNTDPEINNNRITQSLLPSSIYLIFHF
ncbi:MAG: outer membrane beta-barrel protein [Saprospiraceae bacterium]